MRCTPGSINRGGVFIIVDYGYSCCKYNSSEIVNDSSDYCCWC